MVVFWTSAAKWTNRSICCFPRPTRLIKQRIGKVGFNWSDRGISCPGLSGQIFFFIVHKGQMTNRICIANKTLLLIAWDDQKTRRWNSDVNDNDRFEIYFDSAMKIPNFVVSKKMKNKLSTNWNFILQQNKIFQPFLIMQKLELHSVLSFQFIEFCHAPQTSHHGYTTPIIYGFLLSALGSFKRLILTKCSAYHCLRIFHLGNHVSLSIAIGELNCCLYSDCNNSSNHDNNLSSSNSNDH